MKMFRVLVVFCLALGFGLSTVSAEPITHYVVIGDSLSDAGNVHDLTGGAVPPPPYWQGRYSDGPTWIEVRAERLGLPVPTASLSGGTNYAYGGAETGMGESWTGTGALNMGEQVKAYLAADMPTGSEQFVIWGGANDVFAKVVLGQIPDPVASVANLSQHIRNLSNLGAKDFLVMNLPPLGETPESRALGPVVQGYMNAVSAGFNSLLLAKVGQLRSELGVRIVYGDVYDAFMQVIAEPGRWGFTNVTDRAFDPTRTPPIVPNPDKYVFWDNVHPTARAHEVLNTVPEPASIVVLATAGLGLIVLAWRRRRSASTH